MLSTWPELESEIEQVFAHCGSALRYAEWLIFSGACMRSDYFYELQMWWKGQRISRLNVKYVTVIHIHLEFLK